MSDDPDGSPSNDASDPDATGGTADDSAGEADAEVTESTGSEPTEPTDSEVSEQHDPASGDDAPLSDLANRVSRQRRGQPDEDPEEPTLDLDPELSDGPPPDPDDDPFDRMSVGEIDEETLWSSLGSDDPAPSGPLSGVEPVPGAEAVDDAGPDALEHVVPKDKYCQSCPYLDEPPELACTHEGTEIVEVVDSDRFRVRNCPMVEGGVEPEE